MGIYSKKYRFIVAGFLLALYAFMITPATYWHHHHTATTNSQKESASTGKTIVAQADDSSSEGNCVVCSHHYSIHDEAAPVKISIFQSINTSAKALGYTAVPSIPQPVFTNKGPPATGTHLS